MASRWLLAVLAGAFLVQTLAQAGNEHSDWKENEAPAAPTFDRQRIIRIDLPVRSELAFGIDPLTITIGGDGVIRYVLVASSASGGLNALYEAARCATGEFKTYARRSSDSDWVAVVEPTWQAMQESRPSRYAWHLAKQGFCVGRTPAASVAEIVRSLKSGPGAMR